MTRRKTQEEFLQDVFKKLGDKYEVLGEYPGAHGKVLMRHLVCSNTFEKNVHDIIIKGSGCPYCNGSKPALYNEKWVIEHTPLPYHYKQGYEGMKTKCTFHCDVCGADFEQYPSRLINQRIYGCNCCPTTPWTHEKFISELGEVCLQEYEILDNYVNMDTKIRFKHNECGTVFELSPYKFIYRHKKKYCPICYYKKSHGETAIASFLKNNQLEYQREFIFPDFPHRRYDFFLPKLQCAIEFDGQQHFEYTPFFHKNGEQEFLDLQARDNDKNRYCLEHNIALFHIPYSDLSEIEDILTKIFKEKSSTTIEKYLITNIEQSRK